jgi:hypothetical protein
MLMEDRVLAKNYRVNLESSRGDATVARQVFKDIQERGGGALSRRAASSIVSTLSKNRALDEALKVLEFAQERGVRLDVKEYAFVLPSRAVRNRTPGLGHYLGRWLCASALASSEGAAVGSQPAAS